jgi:hypothetical protein
VYTDCTTFADNSLGGWCSLSFEDEGRWGHCKLCRGESLVHNLLGLLSFTGTKYLSLVLKVSADGATANSAEANIWYTIYLIYSVLLVLKYKY